MASDTEENQRENNDNSLINTLDEAEETLCHIHNPGQHWSPKQRRLVYQFLLSHSNGGSLGRKNLISRAAMMFSMPVRTVERIWSVGKKMHDRNSVPDFSSKMKGRVGRKKVHINLEGLKKISFHKRATLRSMAKVMHMSASTLHRRVKMVLIKPHTNAIKPKLTDANKLARLRHCLSMITQNDGGTPMFKDMMNIIHIDEKWFFMSKETQRYYKLPDEEPTYRSCQSKKFINKVMFLGCVARSRFDESRNKMFTGKLGIFPFVYQEPAKRSSKNRPAGTLETKSIESITKDVIRKCLIEKVLPAIRENWPGGNSTGTIWIQQDNARPHVDSNDKEFNEAATLDGFDIRLYNQPPNSPDMNVLDLGYFRAIQSLQQQEASASTDELVEAVKKSFEDLHHDKLNKIFLTLQLCMLETMKLHGCNSYKQPHFRDTVQQNGQIPLQLQCDESLLSSVIEKCS